MCKMYIHACICVWCIIHIHLPYNRDTPYMHMDSDMQACVDCNYKPCKTPRLIHIRIYIY